MSHTSPPPREQSSIRADGQGRTDQVGHTSPSPGEPSSARADGQSRPDQVGDTSPPPVEPGRLVGAGSDGRTPAEAEPDRAGPDRSGIDPTSLAAALAQTRWGPVRLLERTGSTNADLLEWLRQGRASPGQVVLAERQGRGRGRLDRTWSSPPGASVLLSAAVGLPDPAAGPVWTQLPLVAGLAVVGAAADLGVAVRLKWPNDALIDGRKWAGLLIETTQAAGRPVAVIGIGANVRQRQAQLPIAQATSLALAGSTASPPTVAVALLRRLDRELTAWLDGIDPMERYRAASATLGQTVRVLTGPDQFVSGRAVAIADDGRLVVETAQGRQLFAAGDVVHLRAG